MASSLQRAENDKGRVTIRLSGNETQALQDACNLLGIDKSKLIRRAISNEVAMIKNPYINDQADMIASEVRRLIIQLNSNKG